MIWISWETTIYRKREVCLRMKYLGLPLCILNTKAITKGFQLFSNDFGQFHWIKITLRWLRQDFFYSGFGDIVICAFCGLSLNKWLPNDDPITEHRKFNQDCKFVRLFQDKNSNTNRINLNSISSSLFNLRKNLDYYGNIVYFYFHEKILKRRIYNRFINICKICLSEESNILILPCRHVSTCLTCTLCTEICPICRSEIISTIKIFFA